MSVLILLTYCSKCTATYLRGSAWRVDESYNGRPTTTIQILERAKTWRKGGCYVLTPVTTGQLVIFVPMQILYLPRSARRRKRVSFPTTTRSN